MKRSTLVSLLALSLFPFGLAHAGGSISLDTITPNTTVSAGTAISFQIITTDYAGTASYILSDTFPGSTLSNSNVSSNGKFNWTPSVVDVGTHNVTLTAADSFNNRNSLTKTFVIKQASPVSIQSLTPGASIFPEKVLSFMVAAPGFNNPSFSIYDSFSGSSISNFNITSSGIVTWTPSISDIGIHNLTIYIGSGGRSESTYQTITVNGIKVQNATSYNVTSGTPIAFSIATYGLDMPTFYITDSKANNTISNDNLNGSNFSWTPKDQDIGTHTVTINATDSIGLVSSRQVTLTVAGRITAPVINPPVITLPPVVTTPKPPVTVFIFTKALAVGSTGTEVTELQKRLTLEKIYSGPITGTFGPLTKAAVIKYQKAKGISPLGNVGPATRTELNKK